MNNKEKELINVSENEMVSMLTETSQLVAKHNAKGK